MVSKTCVMYRSGSRRSVDLQNTSNCPHNWSKFTRIIKVENRKSTESLLRVACLSLNFQEWFGKLFEIWGTDQSLPWVPVDLKIRKLYGMSFSSTSFRNIYHSRPKIFYHGDDFPLQRIILYRMCINFSTFHLSVSPVLHKVLKLAEKFELYSLYDSESIDV